MGKLPHNVRVIIVRRGNMRCMIPLDEGHIQDTGPAELAMMAMKYFIHLQANTPDRPDTPIGPGAVCLIPPGALAPLDPDVLLWPQLAGRWTEQDVQVISEQGLEGTPWIQCPVAVLNLVDLNTN